MRSPDSSTTDTHSLGELIRRGSAVELRRHVPHNLEAFQRWYADPDIARLLRHDLAPMSAAHSRSYFETLILPMSAAGTCWAIHARATGELLGTTALTETGRANGSGLFRIVIGERDAWDKGFGTEATRLVAEQAFDRLGLRTIRLEVFAHNARAEHVYERVGFRRTGEHVEHLRSRDFHLRVHEMVLRRETYDEIGVFASTEPDYAPGRRNELAR